MPDLVLIKKYFFQLVPDPRFQSLMLVESILYSMEQSKRIDHLFRRYLNGELSPAEWEELRILIADIPEADTETLTAPLFELWEQSRRRELPTQAHTLDREQLFRRITQEEDRSARIFLVRNWRRLAVAALLAGCILVAGLYYQQHVPQRHALRLEEIRPATAKAVLTLSDGSQVILDSAATGEIARQGASTVTNAHAQLRYETSGTDTRTITYNTIATAKAGQYELVLPDGSRLWLNALSSVRFPTCFCADNRTVEVTGEVYFEVTKDKLKPFIVRTGRNTVMVLGTSFNVRDYPDEPQKISLKEGTVKVNGEILKPGEAYLDGKVAETDINQDLAWRNGLFDFQDKKLGDVMRELSRWYDIEVIYPDGIPGIEFAGKLGRDLNLEEVLRALKNSGVKFTWGEDRRLIVRP